MQQPKIGIQMYTLLDIEQKDILGTLRALAQMGYEGIEFFDHGNATVEQIRDVLDETGLIAAGAIARIDQIRDNHKQCLPPVKALGAPAAISPSVPNEFAQNPSRWKEAAALLNEMGTICSDYGLKFSQHIHGNEFGTHNGSRLMDALLADTDPDSVSFVADVYWIEHAGVDAPAFLRKAINRVYIVHMKDSLDRITWHDTEVGMGIVDMESVAEIARENNCPWLVVEQEKFTIPPMESVDISLKNIKGILAGQAVRAGV